MILQEISTTKIWKEYMPRKKLVHVKQGRQLIKKKEKGFREEWFVLFCSLFARFSIFLQSESEITKNKIKAQSSSLWQGWECDPVDQKRKSIRGSSRPVTVLCWGLKYSVLLFMAVLFESVLFKGIILNSSWLREVWFRDYLRSDLVVIFF